MLDFEKLIIVVVESVTRTELQIEDEFTYVHLSSHYDTICSAFSNLFSTCLSDNHVPTAQLANSLIFSRAQMFPYLGCLMEDESYFQIIVHPSVAVEEYTQV